MTKPKELSVSCNLGGAPGMVFSARTCHSERNAQQLKEWPELKKNFIILQWSTSTVAHFLFVTEAHNWDKATALLSLPKGGLAAPRLSFPKDGYSTMPTLADQSSWEKNNQNISFFLKIPSCLRSTTPWNTQYHNTSPRLLWFKKHAICSKEFRLFHPILGLFSEWSRFGGHFLIGRCREIYSQKWYLN